ncbi:MAG: prepilin peptidase [Deltaproteobacteria bacterium]|nr:MAG: prepilin peptidase [Deltaproteobacteria bacterium]
MSDLVVLHSAVVAVVGIAAWTDARSGRIPNWLTLTTIVGALALHLATGGPWGALLSVIGLVLGAACPLLLFWRGAMGGGDVKLFAAIGALLGPELALEAQLASFGVAAFLAMVMMAWRGTMFRTLQNLALTLVSPLLPESRRPEVSTELTSTMRIGLAIFVGTTLVLVGSHSELWA